MSRKSMRFFNVQTPQDNPRTIQGMSIPAGAWYGRTKALVYWVCLEHYAPIINRDREITIYLYNPVYDKWTPTLCDVDCTFVKDIIACANKYNAYNVTREQERKAFAIASAMADNQHSRRIKGEMSDVLREAFNMHSEKNKKRQIVKPTQYRNQIPLDVAEFANSAKLTEAVMRTLDKRGYAIVR